MPNRQELEEEYKNAAAGEEKWRLHKEQLGRQLGKAGPTGGTHKHEVEDSAMATFERMTSAELTELYQTDREAWQELIDGVQSAGERKLANLNRPF
jgi:hypothetical protein